MLLHGVNGREQAPRAVPHRGWEMFFLVMGSVHGNSNVAFLLLPPPPS